MFGVVRLEEVKQMDEFKYSPKKKKYDGWDLIEGIITSFNI